MAAATESGANTALLDEITARFVAGVPEFLSLLPEEYFFCLEEAYWFALDFRNYKNAGSLSNFAAQVLRHNDIPVSAAADYERFRNYRQSIKVYGTMLFSRNFTHCLLVQQVGTSSAITFPKGKKARNETGLECAIRETREEVGYDVSDKIVNMPVSIFGKLTFYPVLNVDMNFPFKTATRNEIGKIFWFDLEKAPQVRTKQNYRIFNVAYSAVKPKLEALMADTFKFDLNSIIQSAVAAMGKQEATAFSSTDKSTDNITNRRDVMAESPSYNPSSSTEVSV